MSHGPDDAPFVAEAVRGGLTDWIGRILEEASPERWVAGGGSERQAFQRRPRNFDTLQRHREIYDAGGPVADLTDKRALMTYGPGVEFQTDDEALTDDMGRTVAEWLDATLGDRFDHLQIQLGVQSYWAGNAWLEVVETRTGEFSHLALIDPTTVDPSWDRHGEIVDIEQLIVDEDGRAHSQPLDADRVHTFTFKDTPGGPLETGLFDRNRDLIERYAKNQSQRANAIRLHGSPHYSIQVGTEGQSIPDKLMRRVRNQFRSDQVDEETNWVHGGDIGVSELDAPGFEGMGSITETDIALLAEGFGIPLELTNFGSDGLGSGKPAEVRWQGFERQARAEQTLRSAQFMPVIRFILEHYSPFPRDVDVSLVFGDVVSDQQAAAEWMREFTSYMTPDEVRERLDLGTAPDDADLGPPEGTPAAESGGGMEGGGGLFAAQPGDDAPDPLDDGTKRQYTDGGTADFRSRGLAEVPDNAVSIGDRSEAPEGASIIEGPRGGTYYVPGGEENGQDGGSGAGDPFDESPEELFADFDGEGGRETVRNLTSRWTGWPTDSETAAMWQAANSVTGNSNDPENISGVPMLENDADVEDVETYEEYHDHLTERLREEHGDEMTAHRFFHSEAAERLEEGESLDPRTMGSWTTDLEQIPDLVEGIPTPSGDFVDPEDAVVVTKDIPVENVFDHHAANPELDDAGQQELIAGLDGTDDLSDGEIQRVSEIASGGEDSEATPEPVAAQEAPADYPTILLGYDFEPPGGLDGEGRANRAMLHGEADADALTREELVWQDVYDRVLWADDAADRALFEFDPEEVPQFVVDRLREAVAAGAVFEDFETIGEASAQRLGDVLLDSLDDAHGWSINSLTENLMDEVPDLDDRLDAERIARTETASLVNTAREEGYREQFDVDEERFDWAGPSDHRTTATCEAIKSEVPDEGLPLPELKTLVRETASEHGHDPRAWVPHVNCRHTYTRQV